MKRITSVGGKMWRIAVCVLVPLLVGGLSALLTAGAMAAYGGMNLPPLSPASWVFPMVWTLLYVLMGVASWLIYQAGADDYEDEPLAKKALIVYGVQLAFNFLWPIAFFALGWYWFAFVWLIAMWAMVLWLVIKTRWLSRAAMWCLVPLLVWTTFATYLNAGVAVLN